MRRINFFKGALEKVNNRVLASYQNPLSNMPLHEKCIALFKKLHQIDDFHLTKSCTQSLEMAFASLDLPLGSEVILPSYAFVSCANAVNNLGYRCVFVDCDNKTLNILPEAVEAAVSPLTRAVLTINYGGVSCNYEAIRSICDTHNLFLIEDNAHGFLAKYKGKYLGHFGDISAISFDHMKNISCEEGGGISVNNLSLRPKLREALEFGTNRLEYFEGKVKEYHWRSKGSNCCLAETLADILYDQLLQSESIIAQLQDNWHRYQSALYGLQDAGKIQLAGIPEDCETNGHIFWLQTKDREERGDLIAFLKSRGIFSSFHYTALHLSGYGQRVGVFRGDDAHTVKACNTLIRLPQHHLLTQEEIDYVVEQLYAFYKMEYN